MSFANASLASKVALFLLPFSIILYGSSLTMKVANVVGTVHLDVEGIEEQLTGDLQNNVPVNEITNQISAGINEVIADEFPIFANQAVFQLIRRGVYQKVRENGADLVLSAMPEIDIPQPAPTCATYG